jgi:hypothetical protein
MRIIDTTPFSAGSISSGSIRTRRHSEPPAARATVPKMTGIVASGGTAISSLCIISVRASAPGASADAGAAPQGGCLGCSTDHARCETRPWAQCARPDWAVHSANTAEGSAGAAEREGVGTGSFLRPALRTRRVAGSSRSHLTCGPRQTQARSLRREASGRESPRRPTSATARERMFRRQVATAGQNRRQYRPRSDACGRSTTPPSFSTPAQQGEPAGSTQRLPAPAGDRLTPARDGPNAVPASLRAVLHRATRHSPGWLQDAPEHASRRPGTHAGRQRRVNGGRRRRRGCGAPRPALVTRLYGRMRGILRPVRIRRSESRGHKWHLSSERLSYSSAPAGGAPGAPPSPEKRRRYGQPEGVVWVPGESAERGARQQRARIRPAASAMRRRHTAPHAGRWFAGRCPPAAPPSDRRPAPASRGPESDRRNPPPFTYPPPARLCSAVSGAVPCPPRVGRRRTATGVNRSIPKSGTSAIRAPVAAAKSYL